MVEQTLFNWVKARREGKLSGADSEAVRVRDIAGNSNVVLRESAAVKYASI